MIIREVEKYDDGHKSFVVEEICCAQLHKDMRENRDWSIEDGEMQCWDYESGFSAKFCPHCGQEIIIK